MRIWPAVRRELRGEGGPAYLEQMTGHPFPKMPATILSVGGTRQRPEYRISIEDGKTQDALIRLTAAWTGPPLTVGSEIEFEGRVLSLIRDPFVLTLEVAPASIEIFQQSRRNSGTICECFTPEELNRKRAQK